MPQSALLIHGVPVECINQAAVRYYVPAKIIISVLNTEGGNVGIARKNDNGTYDVGPMQINTVWLTKLKPYGYTTEKLLNDPCANVEVGTWILSQRISGNEQYFWHGVADYHSYSITPNETYQFNVLKNYQSLNRIIGS